MEQREALLTKEQCEVLTDLGHTSLEREVQRQKKMMADFK